METNQTGNEFKFTKFSFFAILILVLIGIGLCVDLNIIFYKTNWLQSAAQSWCSVSEYIDCDGVAKTTYSLSFGVPNSVWGTLLYLVMLMLLFVDRIQAKFKNTIFDVFKNPSSYIASLALLSFAISMILAFISIKVINKICILCFCTYVVDLLIALFAMKKSKWFILSDVKTTIVDFIDGAKKHFILFIIVLFAFVGTVYYLNDSYILSPKLKKERDMKEFFSDNPNKYPIKGNILGNEKAKVKIVIYSDYNCPFCRVVNKMIHKIVHENKDIVYVEEISYPLDTYCNYRISHTLRGHESSCIASKYALAAKKQNKFWGAANVLFDKHPIGEDEILQAMDKARLGLDLNKLKEDANSEEIAQELKKEIDSAVSRDIMGTPAIEINGVLYMGSMPYEDLKEKIKLADKRANN